MTVFIVSKGERGEGYSNLLVTLDLYQASKKVEQLVGPDWKLTGDSLGQLWVSPNGVDQVYLSHHIFPNPTPPPEEPGLIHLSIEDGYKHVIQIADQRIQDLRDLLRECEPLAGESRLGDRIHTCLLGTSVDERGLRAKSRELLVMFAGLLGAFKNQLPMQDLAEYKQTMRDLGYLLGGK